MKSAPQLGLFIKRFHYPPVWLHGPAGALRQLRGSYKMILTMDAEFRKFVPIREQSDLASMSPRKPQKLAEAGTVSRAEVTVCLERILNSRVFQSAPAQRSFLRYVVEQTLQGRQNLKEYCIAVDVFGRDASFDQRRDSIVRIEARRLRGNLAKYYEGEGRNDSVQIAIPKGGYTPAFAGAAASEIKFEVANARTPSPTCIAWIGRERVRFVAATIVALFAAVVLSVVHTHAAQSTAAETDEAALMPGESIAYEDFLKGRFFLAKHNRAAISEAIRSFRRAISEKPNYAPAYAGLAESYTLLPIFCGTPLGEILPLARESANKAIGFHGATAQAHVALALAADLEFDHTAAEEEFKKALQTGFKDASTRLWYAGHLIQIGELDRAAGEYAIASHLDPVSAEIAQAAGLPLYLQRRYDSAVHQYQSALALDANWGSAHQGLGLTYLAMGRYKDGLAESKIAYGLMGADLVSTGQLGYAYAVSGDRAMARQVLSQLLTRPERAPFPIAEIYIGLGDRDSAFVLLHKAHAVHDGNLKVAVDPVYDSLRTDARFSDFVRLVRGQRRIEYSALARLALLGLPRLDD